MGIPLVVSPRGMLEPWSLAHRSWKKGVAWLLYEKWDLACARVLCATSMEEADSIRRVGCRQPIAVVPNGVSVPQPHARRTRHQGVRNALFLSRIHPKKGLLLLVDAWEKVRPNGWRMIVAGPDEEGHKRLVEDAVRNAGIEEDFIFVGPVEGAAKADLFSSADLFILPTMSENFGLAVAEALAYGIPVITTVGAPWKGLVEHSCGWWVTPDSDALAYAIRGATLLPDAERAAMGSRGRDWMEREFSWSSVARRMISVYEWILHGGSAPDCVHQ